MNEKTLTSEQRATLIAYILMTTKMREAEATAWDKLAEEKTAGGQPRFRLRQQTRSIGGNFKRN